MSTEVLFFDCETGGTEPKTDAILQLSAIIEVDGNVVDEIDLKIKPLQGKTVTAEALEVQGRTVQEVMSFNDPIDSYAAFNKFLARRPAHKLNRYTMAGYNAGFDCDFLNQWYKDISGGPFAYWKYLQFSPIDILPFVRAFKHIGIMDIENCKLGTVCKYFGVEIQAHDSLSDIRATREVTNLFLREFKNCLPSPFNRK